MKIQKSPNWIPGMIRTEILSTPPSPRLSPGFLLRQEVTPATEGSPGVSGPVTAPTPTHRYLLVPPTETESLLDNPEVVSLMKMITKAVAAQIHPHAKLGVDAIFLAYGVKKLIEDWKKPGADRTLCLFKTAGLTLNASHLIGAACPEVRLPDPWDNRIDFVVSVGGDLYKGKVPSAQDLTLGRHPLGKIPLQLLKVAESTLKPVMPPSPRAGG